MKYTVSNVYGIAGESHHRTPEAALRAAHKRGGEGWIVTDDNGIRWDWPYWPIDNYTEAVRI